MKDILDKLVRSAKERLQSGYYVVEVPSENSSSSNSFVREIRERKSNPVIAELKPASPSRGKLFEDEFDPVELAELYLEGGAAGFSVLTDPDHFNSSLENLKAVTGFGVPVLMKDFILSYSQVEAASNIGADAILLIYRLFEREKTKFELEEAIDYAHEHGLEVLLEANDLPEYEEALETEADMIGINNRDLRNLEVDLSTTKNVIAKAGTDRIVWSMSGISDREDVIYLRESGVDAFLVGTSLSLANHPTDYLMNLRGEFDD